MSVFADNFTRLKEHLTRLNKIRTGLWHEAALFSDLDFPTPDEIAGIYDEICGNNDSKPYLPDFAEFSTVFSQVYRGRFGEVFSDTDGDPGILPPKIAYLQNSFSDKAYRNFENYFSRQNSRGQVTAAYFPGFREVCEEVYYGRCSHAMLPISSSRDGILSSFRKLIEKYELKIVLETDVDMGDDTGMRFALLRRGLNLTSPRNFCDLTVVLTSEFTIGAFLSACEIIGASAVSINSYPLEYADDRCGIQITLDISRSDPETLYLFLEGSHISYEVIGMYDLLLSHKSAQNHSNI